MSYDFTTATKAREIAITGGKGIDPVLTEINTLRNAIIEWYSSGELEIDPSTGASDTAGIQGTMGTNALYFEAWNDPFANRSDGTSVYTQTEVERARYQMNEVINYFTRLGYDVSRARDGINDGFYWQIRW